MVVDPVHGVLPYDGLRNPLTRSNTAHRISMAIATAATKGQRKIYYFDGAREMAVTLEALLSPELYGLEGMLAEEGENPICTDPANADREAVHLEIVKFITEFSNL